QGQGRLRQALRRQGPRVQGGRCQVLRRRGRADQVHRLPAQAEELRTGIGQAALGSPVVELPEAQLRPLLAAYDGSVRARRWHTLFVLVCIVVAMALASAEVSLTRLLENIHRFPSYIIRLFQLDSGQPVWTDMVEWFWGLRRWLRLLGETLVMA